MAKRSLLEALRGKVGCQYISDLHYLNEGERTRAAHGIHDTPPEAAALAEWNDALAYLTDEPPAQTAQLARERLLVHLTGAGETAD